MSVIGILGYYRVVEVVQPQHARGDARRVIDAKEVLLLFLDVEDDDACDLHLGQQVLVAKDEEDLAGLLVLLAHHLVLEDGQVCFVALVLRSS